MLLLIFEAKLVCQCLSCSVFENNILHFCESGSTAFGLKGQALPFPGSNQDVAPVFRLPWLASLKLALLPSPGQKQSLNVRPLPRAKQKPEQW